MRRLAGVFLALSMVLGMGTPAAAAPLLEKDVNLDESLRLRDILQGQGIEVVMTRDGDSNPSLLNRARMGGEGDLLVSVHNNSSGSASAHGTEVYAQVNNPEGMQLAERIVAGITSRAGTASRGAKTREGERGDYYSILRNSPVTAVLVEGAFLSNPDEAARLASPDFRQRVAEGIADGVISVVGRAAPAGAGPPPPRAALPLAAPTGLDASGSASGVTLSWGPVGLATLYEVWKDGALVANVNTTSYHDPAPGPGRHRYEVKGVLAVGELRLAEGPAAAVDNGGARVVIDPGHGGDDPGAVTDI